MVGHNWGSEHAERDLWRHVSRSGRAVRRGSCGATGACGSSRPDDAVGGQRPLSAGRPVGALSHSAPSARAVLRVVEESLRGGTLRRVGAKRVLPIGARSEVPSGGIRGRVVVPIPMAAITTAHCSIAALDCSWSWPECGLPRRMRTRTAVPTSLGFARRGHGRGTARLAIAPFADAAAARTRQALLSTVLRPRYAHGLGALSCADWTAKVDLRNAGSARGQDVADALSGRDGSRGSAA